MITLNKQFRTQITDSHILHRYIHGGRGILTLEAPSGKSHTYAFRKPNNASEFPDDVIFVYALHDECKLFYIGMMENGIFRLTHHSRFLEQNEIVKGAKYIVKLSHKPKFNSPMKLYHEGICCRCGRPLTAESSLKQGIGKNCKKEFTDEHA